MKEYIKSFGNPNGTGIGWMLLPAKWMALDKQMHGSWQAFLFVIAAIVASPRLGINPFVCLFFAIIAGGIASYGYELAQRLQGKGTYDSKDIVACMFGVVYQWLFWYGLKGLGIIFGW